MRIPWVQDTINLKANTEYIYTVSSPCNVIMVRNHDDSHYIYMANETVTTSKYDALSIPKSWGSIGQPSQIHKIHLISTTDLANVKLYLILSESPTAFMGNMMRAVEGIVEISATPGLKASELDIDAQKALGVKVTNFDDLEINFEGDISVSDVSVTSSPDLKASELNRDGSKNVGVNVNNQPSVTVLNSSLPVTVGNFEDNPAITVDDLNIDANNNIGVIVKNYSDFPSVGGDGEGGIPPKLSGAILNIYLGTVDTEYSLSVPAGTKKIMVSLRQNDAPFRMAFVSGKVAGSVSPYLACPAGYAYVEDGLLLTSTTSIYFACSEKKHVQVLYWI